MKNNNIIIITIILGVIISALVFVYYIVQNNSEQKPITKIPEKGIFAVCANGDIVSDISGCKPLLKKETKINPDDYQLIILEANKFNYVKSSGKIKLPSPRLGSIWMVIEKVNSPNKELNEAELPFVFYDDEIRPEDDASIAPTYGDYYYIFNAPEIPGDYEVIVSEPFRKNYKIIVIDEVKNELLVYKIADRFIFSKLDEANIRNWNVISKEINSRGNSWEIDLQIEYDSCGIDWESNICVERTGRGKYLIDKKTGIIIENSAF